MISTSKKFIFIHIVKNGGTSVELALKDYFDYDPNVSEGPISMYCRHVSLSEMKMNGIKIENYFKFTTIRNPWERIVSLYFYEIQRKHKEPDIHEKDFNSWVKNIFANGKNIANYWTNQLDWISIDGKISVDYIIRLENIQNEWNEVCKKIDVQVEIPYRNRTTHEPYYTYYDSDSIDIVTKIFQRDIDAFGYKFLPENIVKQETDHV